MRDEITYSFSNLNGTAVEVSDWLTNFIPCSTAWAFNYISTMLVKEPHVAKWGILSPCIERGKVICIIWTHKGHPIVRSGERATGYLLWVFWSYMSTDKTHCAVQCETVFYNNIPLSWYYDMVDVAVAMVIPTMHEKSCIDSHNYMHGNLKKSSTIQSFTHLANTVMKLRKYHSHEFLKLS